MPQAEFKSHLTLKEQQGVQNETFLYIFLWKNINIPGTNMDAIFSQDIQFFFKVGNFRDYISAWSRRVITYSPTLIQMKLIFINTQTHQQKYKNYDTNRQICHISAKLRKYERLTSKEFTSNYLISHKLRKRYQQQWRPLTYTHKKEMNLQNKCRNKNICPAQANKTLIIVKYLLWNLVLAIFSAFWALVELLKFFGFLFFFEGFPNKLIKKY